MILIDGFADFLVELGVFIFIRGFSVFDGSARVKVLDAGEHIRNYVAPFNFFSHREHIVFDDF